MESVSITRTSRPAAGSTGSRGRLLCGLGLVMILGLAACSGSTATLSEDGDATSSTTSVVGSATSAVTVDGAVPADTDGADGAGSAGAGSGGSGGSGGGTPATVPAVSSDMYKVPNLNGLSLSAAEQAIRERGLVSIYVRINEWQIPRDVVIAQDQIPFTQLQPGGVVSYRISTGPEIRSVPSTIGQCSTTAQATLRAAGFASTFSFVGGGGAKFHRVISQSPGTGLPALQGTTVAVDVSNNGAVDGCS